MRQLKKAMKEVSPWGGGAPTTPWKAGSVAARAPIGLYWGHVATTGQKRTHIEDMLPAGL